MSVSYSMFFWNYLESSLNTFLSLFSVLEFYVDFVCTMCSLLMLQNSVRLWSFWMKKTASKWRQHILKKNQLNGKFNIFLLDIYSYLLKMMREAWPFLYPSHNLKYAFPRLATWWAVFLATLYVYGCMCMCQCMRKRGSGNLGMRFLMSIMVN